MSRVSCTCPETVSRILSDSKPRDRPLQLREASQQWPKPQFRQRGDESVQTNLPEPRSSSSSSSDKHSEVCQSWREAQWPQCGRWVSSECFDDIFSDMFLFSCSGTDSTHLTMFEMMGSWSFGDYWKREACTMAWHLVTEVFKLEREKLFVTYFAGSGDLQPDLETRDIWRSLSLSR